MFRSKSRSVLHESSPSFDIYILRFASEGAGVSLLWRAYSHPRVGTDARLLSSDYVHGITSRSSDVVGPQLTNLRLSSLAASSSPSPSSSAAATPTDGKATAERGRDLASLYGTTLQRGKRVSIVVWNDDREKT